MNSNAVTYHNCLSITILRRITPFTVSPTFSLGASITLQSIIHTLYPMSQHIRGYQSFLCFLHSITLVRLSGHLPVSYPNLWRLGCHVYFIWTFPSFVLSTIFPTSSTTVYLTWCSFLCYFIFRVFPLRLQWVYLLSKFLSYKKAIVIIKDTFFI